MKYKHKFYVKRKKPFKKFRRIHSSLDRLYNTRFRALRTVVQPPNRMVNRRLMGRTLRIVGLSGQQLVGRARGLFHKGAATEVLAEKLSPALTTPLRQDPLAHLRKYNMRQKYRLKLAPILNPARASRVYTFHLHPRFVLGRAHRAVKTLRQSSNETVRAYTFSREVLKNKQYLLRACQLTSVRIRPKRQPQQNKHQPSRPKPRNKLPLRVRLRLRKKVLSHRRHTVSLSQTRLHQLKHRSSRSGRAAIEMAYFRRH